MKKNADLILETVLQSSAHMTAEEIHAALRDSGHRMALATVYNNLAQLHSEGRIRKVCVEGHPDRYDKMIRHDHLVCRRCGKLTDICFQDLTKLRRTAVLRFTGQLYLSRMPKDGAPSKHDRPMKGGVFL